MKMALHVRVWNVGLKGRWIDSSGRSPEILETMHESPERAKDAINFLFFRPYQGSCFCNCPTPGWRPELSFFRPSRPQANV